jgi:hypothetical protein
MAQVETSGGGFLDTGDRRIIKKSYVSTGGTINIPPQVSGFPLTSVNAVEEPGGIRRVSAEYSQGGAGDASYNQYGKRIELSGGTREVPIQSHAQFEQLSQSDIEEVEKKLRDPDYSWAPSAKQALLYSFLSRGVEYVLAPAVVGRVSTIESNLPNLNIVAKVMNPSELNAPPKTFWICTAVTATPIGNRYEVTREFTLNFAGWDDVVALYGWS